MSRPAGTTTAAAEAVNIWSMQHSYLPSYGPPTPRSSPVTSWWPFRRPPQPSCGNVWGLRASV